MISERNYKVGDVVRTLVDTDYAGVELFPKGTIGTIVNIDCKDRHPFTVAADGEYWHYSAIMIEPVDEDGTPKQEPCEDWCDVPSDEMTLEQAWQAVKDLRKKLAGYLEQESCDDIVNRKLEELFERVENIEKQIKEDKEEQLRKLKAEVDYASLFLIKYKVRSEEE